MVGGAGGGEDGLFHAAEEALAQRLVGFELGQQPLAVIVGLGSGVQCIAVDHHRALEDLANQSQPSDQRMDGHQHRPGDIVGVDLIATQHHQRGTRFGPIMLRLEPGIGTRQAILARMMRTSAGAVQECIDA